VSYRRIPTVTSEKRIQAFDPEDTTLSAPTADYEFHFRRRLRERSQDFSISKNLFVSYERIPTVTSKKRVQAFNPEDTALSAPTADYEFHPIDRVN